ncbi:MAG: hypothetical protein ACRBBJ_01670 [Rhodomicrobiaceae bacterium]
MAQIDQSDDMQMDGSWRISAWVWFMSLLNLVLILTLGYVLWKVIPGGDNLQRVMQERDRIVQERDLAKYQYSQEVAQRKIMLEQAKKDRDQAIISRNQAIIERDQAFIQRDKAFDERYRAMIKRFDEASKTLNALDSQLTLAQENQKKLGVLMLGQTDSFNATVNKLEELSNALPR